MGSGRWNDTDWGAYTKTTRSQSRQEIFRSTSINAGLDPRNIKVRESFDSVDNPNSTPVVVALDVTGSMGMIAEHMAKESLGALVKGIYERRPIQDPHVMLMGVGDITCDSAPLQVTQFEADIRVADQLKNIWLEGNGGGNSFESYDLPWYFVANYTDIDSFKKRRKKGYLFTIGDELPPKETLTRDRLQRVFGAGVEAGVTSDTALAAAQERYAVFHVIVEQGNYCRHDKTRVTQQWREKLGANAISLNNYYHISEVILSVMEVAEGADPETVIASWPDADVRASVGYALAMVAETA